MVIEELKAAQQLQRLTITNPAAFNGLPHHTTLRHLKLADLPQYCPDWSWLKANEGLKEIYVSYEGTQGHSEEILHVAGEKAELKGMTEDGTMKIMENLSHGMCTKVG